MKNKNKIIYYALSIVLIILVDQIIKIFAINKNMPIIPGILSINYTENYGIAFSMLQNRVIILLVTIVLFIITTIYTVKKLNNITTIQLICISSILAGGVSNFLDRIIRGYVIDYINIEFFKFPIFNFADICITLGVMFLGISMIKYYKNIN